MPGYLIAVDVGGTFTDLVAVDLARGTLHLSKVPSTPPDFYGGVVAAIEKIKPDFSQIGRLVHGTTAHLNAFLERKGAHAALLTTRGFGDVYEMRRGARLESYDLHFRYPDPLISRRDIFELTERMDSAGATITPLDIGELDDIVQELRRRGILSVAICFLHSYRNPVHEQQAADHLRRCAPELFVTPSVEVCREWREYERTSTVAMNAYVSPILGRYLRRLRSALADRGFANSVYLMQSHGGTIGAANAESRGVLTLMSGPVGGNVGCRALSQQLDERNLICVDMGGTSFDISLVIDGESAITSEKSLGGQPVLAPMVDIHTIGAGGGSIAWVDAGSLRVGPHSAGAVPGPACYGRGGTEPTVTDANLVLGRLEAGRRYGGDIVLQPELATQAVARLAQKLNLDTARMAQGIIDVVNAQMANAIRTMTIQRGIDPREFTLVAFGGAGPVHAIFLAEELGIRRIIVPGLAGTFSAWGMLGAEVRHDLAQTHTFGLRELDAGDLSRRYEELESELATLMRDEGVEEKDIHFRRTVDMRYAGQEHYINVPLPDDYRIDADILRQEFTSIYRGIFGHSNLAEEVEVVNLRVEARGPQQRQPAGLHRAPWDGAPETAVVRDAVFGNRRVPTRFIDRAALLPGEPLDGPLIVDEESCTTVVPPGYSMSLLESGHLLIEQMEATA